MQKNKSPWLIFFIVAVAQFMVVLDTSITNVALPSIKQALHFSDNTLQWVITAYALTFGGFLLLGGRTADLFGRRRTLQVGMICFTIFSLLIGISHSAMLLIILRALQGIAAALMSPSALSIVLTTFREGKNRNKALGLWTTVATGGAAVGLLLGGILTQYFGWQWNFFINVPIGILVTLAIPTIVPAHEKEESHKDLDLPGAALITTGLVSFVLAISQAPIWGLENFKTIAIFAISIVLIILFIVNESRTKFPLVPLSLFKVRNITGANLMMAPVAATMYGMFFLTSLYLQTVLQLSPVATGLSFLPFPIILGTVSPRTAHFVSKYGYKRFLIVGPIIIALSLLWMIHLPMHGNYFINVLPTILLMPIGVGTTFMPIIAAATSGVPAHEAGLASGLISTSQQMGGALGLSILSGVAASFVSPIQGYDMAFLTAICFVIFAMIFGIFVIQQQARPSSQAAITLE